MESQFGIKVLWDERLGGQSDFNKNTTRSNLNPYGYHQDNKRIEGFAKMGFFFKNDPLSSVGLIFSGLHHRQNSYWGLRDYEARQNNFSVNGIFQTEFTPDTRLRAGLSFMWDDYEEEYVQTADNQINRSRSEYVPGIFAEYFWNVSPKFSVIAGLRGDYHNLFGAFASPRLHLKYELTSNTILRASAGKGFRVSNPIIENMSYLISSRTLNIADDLNPEIAWNYGGSISQQFVLADRTGSLIVDFYRTDFKNQAVVDLDSSTDQLQIYNLSGNAFANSLQVSANYEILEGFDINLAYKYYDIKTTIAGRLIETPFVAKNRFFVNLEYATYFDKWVFDFTTQWIGKQRIPNTSSNPAEFQMRNQSPSYFLFNAQITKNYKKWAFYIGGENLANFKQDNPIIDVQNPFGDNFDAGLVYAPILGRMLYFGFRFTIKDKRLN